MRLSEKWDRILVSRGMLAYSVDSVFPRSTSLSDTGSFTVCAQRTRLFATTHSILVHKTQMLAG
jgi:hypothetical protein